MAELTREQIEEQLIQEMQAASARYLAKEGHADDYRRALQRFNDFILRGVVPGDLQLPAKPVRSENGPQNGRAKKA